MVGRTVNDLKRRGDPALMQRTEEHDPTKVESQSGERSRQVPPRELPKSIGRYRIIREINIGSFNLVYHAKDTKNNKEIALKVKAPPTKESELSDADYERLIEHESRILKNLGHDNIVRVYGRGYEIGVGLPLEYLPITARKAIRGTLPNTHYPNLTRYLLDIAEGLAYLHAKGLVHTDIKPSNTLGTQEEGVTTIKLIDFNRAAEIGRISLEQVGLGAPGYSPSLQEILEHKITPAIDIYELGRTVLQLALEIHGVEFRGDKPETEFSRYNNRTLLLLLHRHNAPYELQKIVSDCLHNDPKKRPRSPELVERSLELLCVADKQYHVQ